MNKKQTLLIVLVIMVASNFLIPMLLGSFELGFDIPLFGHVTLFDPENLFGSYGFLLGGGLTVILVYLLWDERRKNT